MADSFQSDTVSARAGQLLSRLRRIVVTRTGYDLSAPGDLVLGQQYAYAYDPVGNRVTAAEGDTARVASYTANALNQYTQRTVPDEKDMIGTAPTNVAVTVNQNPASRQSAYWHHALEVDNASSAAYAQAVITAVYNPPGTNDPDIVTSQTGRVFVAQTPEGFTYDDDGNLTQDGRFTYTWNGENRLIKAETRNDLPVDVPRVKVEYAYDHQGRRVAAATSTWTNDAWQAVESRAFIYDGWNVIREAVAVGSGSPQSVITNLYTWGLDLSGSLQGAGGVGGLLAVTTVSNPGTLEPLNPETFFPCFDANGNVTEYVEDSGTIAAHYEYDPFGNTVVQSGDLADAFTHRFSTKPWCAVTGLSEYLFRKYEPGMGRWLSRDPIEEDGGLNGFSFSENDPLNLYDKLGLFGAGKQYAKTHGFIAVSVLGISLDQLVQKPVPFGHSDFAGGNRFDFVKEDVDPLTGPENPFSVGNHFLDLNEATKKAEDAADRCVCDRNKFERAAHQVQDYFSHSREGYQVKPFLVWKNLGLGHLFAGIFGDDPDDNFPAWSDAEFETIRLVKMWDDNECWRKQP